MFPLIANILLAMLLASCGGSSSGNSSSVVAAPKKIVVTSSTYDGNFGGSAAAAIAGADSDCAANLAGSKALLGSSERYPDVAGSGAKDWVLAANQTYQRADGTVIATTNASAVFDFSLTASISSAGAPIWTGLSATWSVTGNCTDWTDGTNGVTGGRGDSGSITSTAIFQTQTACNQLRYIYCVEQ